MLQRFVNIFTTPRMGRRAFILWSLALLALWILTYFVGAGEDQVLPLSETVAPGLLIYWFAAIVYTVISIAFTVRRLHDTNRSGWWYLLNLVPVVGLILLFIWTVLTPGTPGTNRFGPSPIDPTAEVADVFGAEGNAPAPSVMATSGVGDSGEYKFACPQCGKLNLMSEVKCKECGTRT